MKHLFFASFALLVGIYCCHAEAGSQTYGKSPTIKKSTPIATLQAKPKKYKGKTVLVSGKVVTVCQGSGCWVEVEADDNARVICKSMDESVLFPKDVVGKTIQVQGKVLYDAKAPGMRMAKEEGGEAHACPAPQVLLSIEGATVTELAEAAPEAQPQKE